MRMIIVIHLKRCFMICVVSVYVARSESHLVSRPSESAVWCAFSTSAVFSHHPFESAGGVQTCLGMGRLYDIWTDCVSECRLELSYGQRRSTRIG